MSRPPLADPSRAGLRRMTEREPSLFSEWEKADRPYPWSAQNFVELLESGGVGVLEEAGRPVGFAALQVVGDEAYLQNILICRDHRRRGLGESLLQKVMIWASSTGAHRLLLDVDPANEPAVGLYRKAGFETVARRPRSYPRGEDALLMRKIL